MQNFLNVFYIHMASNTRPQWYVQNELLWTSLAHSKVDHSCHWHSEVCHSIKEMCAIQE